MTTTGPRRSGRASFAALAGGPFLWALSTELGPILPYAECRAGFPILAPIAFSAALVSLIFGGWSWSVVHAADEEPLEAHRHSSAFLARLGGLAGLMFALALFYQGLASFLLDGCQR